MTKALPLLCLLACAPKSGEGTVEADDTASHDTDEPAQCGSMDGFASGVVTGPYDPAPNANARVHAVRQSGGEPVTTATNSAGTYELNLLGGERWVIYAESQDCYSDDQVLSVVECTEYELNIDIEECDVADKPNLYLYPARDTPTTVRIRHTAKQRIVASDPPYAQGWDGVAHTDGTFSVLGERAPFLFYEVSLAPWQSRQLQRQRGWCVPAQGAVDAMAGILEAYNFNAGEVDDFVEAWRHDLPDAAGYAVYPQLRVGHMAALDISPPLPVDRLWLLVEDGAGCDIPATPAVVPFDRSGPHAMEWGVVLHGIGR